MVSYILVYKAAKVQKNCICKPFCKHLLDFVHPLIVTNVAQKEPNGWCSRARTREVETMQNVAKLLNRIASATHIDQRAHDGTNHISQKTVGTNGEDEQVAILRIATPLGLCDVADIGLII